MKIGVNTEAVKATLWKSSPALGAIWAFTLAVYLGGNAGKLTFASAAVGSILVLLITFAFETIE